MYMIFQGFFDWRYPKQHQLHCSHLLNQRRDGIGLGARPFPQRRQKRGQKLQNQKGQSFVHL
jgi:hypothetical protein